MNAKKKSEKKCKICNKPISIYVKHIKLPKTTRVNEDLVDMYMCEDCTKILVRALERCGD